MSMWEGYFPLPFILIKSTEIEMLNSTFKLLVSIEPKATLLWVTINSIGMSPPLTNSYVE